MKNYILILSLFLSFIVPSYGQITVAATLPGDFLSEIQVVNLSLSGKKIEVLRHQYSSSNSTDTIFFYNLDYSLWKTIACPAIPGYWGFYNLYIDMPYSYISVSYASETLFNSDTLLEILVPYIDSVNTTHDKLLIINENGIIVDSITNINVAWPFTIHNISSSTFIATATTPSGPIIYNLPGTLPCDVCGGGLGLAKTEEKPTNLLSSPIPNPSKDQVKISFALPDGANRGELTIYNTEGKKMKSYTVDNRFGFILVDDSQFAPGMYYYNLTVNGQISSSQKMLVIK